MGKKTLDDSSDDDEGPREDEGRSVAGRSTAYSRADTSFYTDDNGGTDLDDDEEDEEEAQVYTNPIPNDSLLLNRMPPRR